MKDEGRRMNEENASYSSFIIPTSSFSSGGIFLLHFPSDHSAWTLSSTVPCAVRTFLTGKGLPRHQRDRH